VSPPSLAQALGPEFVFKLSFLFIFNFSLPLQYDTVVTKGVIGANDVNARRQRHGQRWMGIYKLPASREGGGGGGGGGVLEDIYSIHTYPLSVVAPQWDRYVVEGFMKKTA
jgi:hypothetical protein